MQNATVKTIEEIKQAYLNKEYHTKLPYVTPKKYEPVKTETILWNEQKEKEHLDAIAATQKARRDDVARLDRQMKDDIVTALMDYGSFSREQAQTLFDFVWSEKSSHVIDVFDALYEYADVVEKIINLGKGRA